MVNVCNLYKFRCTDLPLACAGRVRLLAAGLTRDLECGTVVEEELSDGAPVVE